MKLPHSLQRCGDGADFNVVIFDFIDCFLSSLRLSHQYRVASGTPGLYKAGFGFSISSSAFLMLLLLLIHQSVCLSQQFFNGKLSQ
jgi:hypothetical protein